MYLWGSYVIEHRLHLRDEIRVWIGLRAEALTTAIRRFTSFDYGGAEPGAKDAIRLLRLVKCERLRDSSKSDASLVQHLPLILQLLSNRVWVRLYIATAQVQYPFETPQDLWTPWDIVLDCVHTTISRTGDELLKWA